MDIKELIKLQMISGSMSQSSSANRGVSQMFYQFVMFFMMSIIDDITSVVPKAFGDFKKTIMQFCKKKVQDTIDISPKNLLNDTSISLSTRHTVNSFSMKRIYNIEKKGSSSNASSSDASNDTSNQIVDAVLAQISKLNNIPEFDLIENGGIMITYKDKPIQMTKDVYMKIGSIGMTPEGKVSVISMSLLSNTYSAAEIVDYVKNLYSNYLQEMKNSLGNSIYFFDQKSRDSGSAPQFPVSKDEASVQNHKRMLINTAPKQLCFTMAPFYSNKQFSNICGEEVRLIEQRVRFFTENRKWYDSKGIPYQLGLLLSGKPGCGKTSIIRGIANMTKRHIINVNFSNITTATQLKNMFYSDRIQVYQDSSMASSQSYFIPIEQRLYVLEEIDAIGNIVRQRTENDDSPPPINDELTLMEILTVLDGTMEVPGRMIIMTTNHPEVLDEALIRPGRIDVQVDFDYAKSDLIAEMFEIYLDRKMGDEYLCKLPHRVLTPAEVGQVLFRHFNTNSSDEKIVDDLVNSAKCHYKKRCKGPQIDNVTVEYEKIKNDRDLQQKIDNVTVEYDKIKNDRDLQQKYYDSEIDESTIQKSILWIFDKTPSMLDESKVIDKSVIDEKIVKTTEDPVADGLNTVEKTMRKAESELIDKASEPYTTDIFTFREKAKKGASLTLMEFDESKACANYCNIDGLEGASDDVNLMDKAFELLSKAIAV